MLGRLGLAVCLVGAVACGSSEPKCETPKLHATPEKVEQGGKLKVLADPKLLPCRGSESGTEFLPIPENTFELLMVIAPATRSASGAIKLTGKPNRWTTAGYDPKDGILNIEKELPFALTPGDYAVYIASRSEYKAFFSVNFSGVDPNRAPKATP